MVNERNANTDYQDEQARRREVQLRAYAIWEAKGKTDGHDVEDWLEAEG